MQTFLGKFLSKLSQIVLRVKEAQRSIKGPF